MASAPVPVKNVTCNLLKLSGGRQLAIVADPRGPLQHSAWGTVKLYWTMNHTKGRVSKLCLGAPIEHLKGLDSADLGLLSRNGVIVPS